MKQNTSHPDLPCLGKWRKQIFFNHHLYDFDNDGVTIDGEQRVYLKRELWQMLSDVVRHLGKHTLPNPDPFYWNHFSNNQDWNKPVLIRHIYRLMYETTQEFQIEEQAKNVFKETPRSFTISVRDVTLSDEEVYTCGTSDSRIFSDFRFAFDFASRSCTYFNIIITENTCF